MSRILITTGIYPPEIGGPAQYAFHLVSELQSLGHEVKILKFSQVRRWPTGLRHLIFFGRLLPLFRWSDWCLALDTFSVALPTVAAARFCRKKVLVRAGGDFLWERYVERTGKKVLLRHFYQTEMNYLSFRERVIFLLTKWFLHRTDYLVFSTRWQQEIWRLPYKLDGVVTRLVENFYGPKEPSLDPVRKNFVAATRPLKWKNLDLLATTFAEIAKESEVSLDLETCPYPQFLEKIKSAYAVILISLGDISPNLVLDALRYDKPIILTRESGLADKLKEVVLLVDPLDKEQIKSQVRWLLAAENYCQAQNRVRQFRFTHFWREIAQEFVALSAS